jgi:hypothetical protein
MSRGFTFHMQEPEADAAPASHAGPGSFVSEYASARRLIIQLQAACLNAFIAAYLIQLVVLSGF